MPAYRCWCVYKLSDNLGFPRTDGADAGLLMEDASLDISAPNNG